MTADVLRFLKQQLPNGAHVICAVSGGPDSMALLRAVLSIRDALGIRVSCAHFNHHLRGAESDADEAFVREFCAQLDIALICSGGDVACEASETGESLEAAARRLRYAFLLSIDPEAYILTAHTADDNLETMLMHLIRGASLRGLAGIPAIRGRVLRPILGCTRDDVMQYLAQTKTPYRIDSSNKEDDCLRNRVRHHMVPLLKAENPSVAQSALAAAARMREEDALLDALASEALDKARSADALSCTVLRTQPAALLRRAIRLALAEWDTPELSSRHIEAVCALVFSDDPSAQISLPGGLCARREYDALAICAEPLCTDFAAVPLNIPGTTTIEPLGLSITCQIAHSRELDDIPCDFAVHYTGTELFVRPRQPGDTIRLNAGTKTLKKLLIDRKIPAALRCRIPVFADADGVVAVGGIGVHLDRLAQEGKPVLCIQIKKETLH